MTALLNTSSPTGPVGDSPTPPPAPARSISVGASADATALVTLAGNVAEAGALAVDLETGGGVNNATKRSDLYCGKANAANTTQDCRSAASLDFFPKLLRKTEGAGVE